MMVSSVRTHVDGLSELGRRMATLKRDTALKFAGRATGKAAQVVKRAAKEKLRSNPSVDTGLVEKNVITKKLRKSQTTFTAEHIVTVKKVEYPLKGNETVRRNTRQVGGYLEFGTINETPEPYLRPAIHQNTDKATAAMAESLEKDLMKAGA